MVSLDCQSFDKPLRHLYGEKFGLYAVKPSSLPGANERAAHGHSVEVCDEDLLPFEKLSCGLKCVFAWFL